MKKQKTEKLNTNKGITLIALVITIIVMLILVAVTITMAVNGGLFEYAGKAAQEINGAIANEQQLANLETNMTVDQLIDKYTGGTNNVTKTISFTIDGIPYTVEEGMTWEEWINSEDYDSGEACITSGYVFDGTGGYVLCYPDGDGFYSYVEVGMEIWDGGEYKFCV